MSGRMGARKRRVRVEILLDRDGSTCVWCCVPLIDKPIDPNKDCSLHLTLEHLMPLSLGGTHDPVNLALACYRCNNSRGNQAIEFEPEWAVRSEYEVLASTHGSES